jgi:hypothetical protein
MREGEEAERRGRSCCFERDGVGKPERGQLRHMLPHCTWGSEEGEEGGRGCDEDSSTIEGCRDGTIAVVQSGEGRREKGDGRKEKEEDVVEVMTDCGTPDFYCMYVVVERMLAILGARTEVSL